MSGKADTDLMSLIKRLAGLLQQNIDAWLRPYDLARTQYIVLCKLEEGDLTAGDLAMAIQVEPATLSGLIDTLEDKGLVRRLDQPEDKRRKIVQLTQSGCTLVSTIPAPGPHMERVLRQDVDPGDVHILKAVGHQMVRSLEQELQKQGSKTESNGSQRG